MNKRAVVKFGGADLSTGEKISRAVKMIVEAPYKEVIVVVSAMGKMTDNLVETIQQIGNVEDADYAEIISMGERTSARVFCAGLRHQGVKAEFMDPTSENWPIITDSNFRNGSVNYEKTLFMVRKHLLPLMAKVVPVVCGFLGKDENGRITTLGRGGSDTTALLLAKCVEADEIVLVKETNGVLSADPKIVSDARLLTEIDIHEMFDLAQGGAKIVKPEALKYKLSNQILRIVDFSSGQLASGGTEITGFFNLNSAEANVQEDLLSINMVCNVNTENLREIFMMLGKNPIYGVSTGRKSLTLFMSDGNVNDVINRLHSLPAVNAISHRENVAMLQLTHPMFVDSPGGVAKISSALSQKCINIIEVTTSKATINVFIEENQLTRAKEAINDVFKS